MPSDMTLGSVIGFDKMALTLINYSNVQTKFPFHQPIINSAASLRAATASFNSRLKSWFEIFVLLTSKPVSVPVSSLLGFAIILSLFRFTSSGGEETKAKFGGDITGINFALPLLPVSLFMLPPSELENELRISIAFCAFTAEAMSAVELVDGVSIICKVELFSCSDELPLPPPLPPIMLTIGGKLAKSCEPSVWLK
uniref:Uncharacterized protein n=1 Tax=Glossina palpalis gambiensis TaxID=67801 RepID=A0A1B0BLX4_9MUSC